MQKSKLDKFIQKYNLGGNVNSVKWKSSGDSISTSFVTPDKSLLGSVKVDKFLGTSHFRTSINEGREIVSTMQGRLSGICQPTYVLDIPGGHGKVPLLNSAASEVDESDCQYSVKDYQGRFHVYIDTEES